MSASSPRRAGATDVSIQVINFAARAGTELRKLHLLSETLMNKLFAKYQTSDEDRVQIETYVACVRDERMTVGEVAERQERIKLYPRIEPESRANLLMDRFQAEFDAATSAGSDPFDPVSAAFAANAKVSVVLSWILFTKEKHAKLGLAPFLPWS